MPATPRATRQRLSTMFVRSAAAETERPELIELQSHFAWLDISLMHHQILSYTSPKGLSAHCTTFLDKTPLLQIYCSGRQWM
jgi:hypothetical protein